MTMHIASVLESQELRLGRLVNNLKSDEDLELQKKKITTDNIIHVSSVEFHEELNGTTPGAVKVGPKKRTQKNCKIQPKTG